MYPQMGFKMAFCDEAFVASLKMALKWSKTCVGSEMDIEIPRNREIAKAITI